MTPVQQEVPCASKLAKRFDELKLMLQQAEEADEERAKVEEAKVQLVDSFEKLHYVENARVTLQAKVQRLEAKLEKRHGEINKLTTGIQDLVDRYEGKLKTKKQ